MKYREGSTPDCTLELDFIEVVEAYQPARPRNATPDVELPNHIYPFMHGRKWGDDSVCTTNPAAMKPAGMLKAVTVGHKAPKMERPYVLVQTYASIMLDRESGAREFHKVYFTADQWNRIAANVHTDDKVILEGCTIFFDPKDEPVTVDTLKHYDFADGRDGFSTGTFKTYIPGMIADVAAISTVHSLRMSDETEGRDEAEEMACPQLPLFDILYNRAYPPPEPDFEDDDYPEYQPPLSEFYDDLEELELNTRGDGFD